MKFNVLKYRHISFCGKQVQIDHRYMISNEIIKQVNSIKYLGVIIEKKITWSQQVDKITLKANRVSGFLYRTSNTALWISKTDAIKYLFNQYWSMHQLYGPPTMTNI